jgi:hypothetical protein
MTIRRKTTGILPAVSSNQETVTMYIPAGQEIEVLEGGRAPLGYVLIRWKAYTEPLRGLFVLESDIRDLTE